MRHATIVLCAALLMAACQPPAPQTVRGPDIDAIRARDAALGAAIQRRDAQAAASFYEVGGRIIERTATDYTPIGPQNSYATLFADAQSAMQLSRIEVDVAGSRDLAVSVGECAITRHQEGPLMVLHEECMKSWRRSADGQWRIATEARVPVAMFTSTAAPSP